MNIDKMLCGHDIKDAKISGGKMLCSACGSFWDLNSATNEYRYGDDYPAQREHSNELVGSLKVKTMRRWINNLELGIENMSVCEFGFGGGYCLKYLHNNAKSCCGIEAVDENISNAVKLGVPEHNVHKFTKLPKTLYEKVDLWLFQDSFEHLDDPDLFLDFIENNSNKEYLILIVMPEAGSPSELLMKRFWPHILKDHKFHWSRKGIIDFMKRKGFICRKSFKPKKCISLKMALLHIQNKFGVNIGNFNRYDFLNKEILFNIGEMGLLFKKHEA